MTPRLAGDVDRRQMLRVTGRVLAVGAAALVAGCGDVKEAVRELPRPHPRRRADNKDQPLLESARRDQEDVLAVCVAVRERHPGLDSVLDPVIEHHQVHLQALGSDAATASPASPGSGPNVPAVKRRALRLVIDTEKAAAHARARDTLDAASGDFARVLAAISAGCAQHVVELGDARAALGRRKRR